MTELSSHPSQTNRSWLTAVLQRCHESYPQETAPQPVSVDLSKVVLDMVFSQLSAPDLVKCAAVNKRWQASVADERHWQPLANALRLPDSPSKSHQAAVSAFYAADAKEQPHKKRVYQNPPMVVVTEKPEYGHEQPNPTFLHFSPDGRTLVTGHREVVGLGAARGYQGLVRLRAAATGAITAVIKFGAYDFSAVFSPDSRTLAVEIYGGDYGGPIKLIDVATGAVRATVHGKSMAFSPDGRILATGQQDGAVQIRDAVTGSVKTSLQHSRALENLTFSPDSRMLATQHADDTVCLTAVDTGEVKGSIANTRRQGGPVISVAFSPDSSTLATASKSKIVHLMSTKTGTIREATTHGDVARLLFSPDSQTLAVEIDMAVHLIDSATGASMAKIKQKHYTGMARSMAFSPNSRALAIGYRSKFVNTNPYDGPGDGNLCLVDVGTGLVRKTIKHEHAVDALAFSADSRMLVTGSAHGVMRFVGTTGRVWAVARHEGEIRAVTLGQHGIRFAAVSSPGAVHLITLDVRSRRLVAHRDGNRTAAACQRGAEQVPSSHGREPESWLKSLLCFRPGLPFVPQVPQGQSTFADNK